VVMSPVTDCVRAEWADSLRCDGLWPRMMFLRSWQVWAMAGQSAGSE
jgi:hypothetical protein